MLESETMKQNLATEKLLIAVIKSTWDKGIDILSVFCNQCLSINTSQAELFVLESH